MQKNFQIEVDCANCAAKIEAAINKIEGVNSASISFMAQKMVLDADDANFDRIVKEIVKVGKKIEPDFELDV